MCISDSLHGSARSTQTLKSTYTHQVLPVSSATYAEIARLLREAGYDHVFQPHHEHGTIMDMHGIALTNEDELEREVRL